MNLKNVMDVCREENGEMSLDVSEALSVKGDKPWNRDLSSPRTRSAKRRMHVSFRGCVSAVLSPPSACL